MSKHTPGSTFAQAYLDRLKMISGAGFEMVPPTRADREEWTLLGASDTERVELTIHQPANGTPVVWGMAGQMETLPRYLAAPDLLKACKAGGTGAILDGPELLERVALLVAGEYPHLNEALLRKAKAERTALAKAEEVPK